MSKYYRVTYQDYTTGKKGTRDWYVPTEATARRLTFEKLGHVLDIKHSQPGILDRSKFPKEYKLVFLNAVRFHLECGSSPGEALFNVIESEENSGLRASLQPAFDILQRGGSFSEALEVLRMFDDTTLTMIQTGEATGELSKTIVSASEYLDRKQGVWKNAAVKMTFIAFEFVMGFSGVLFMPQAVEMATGDASQSLAKNPEKAAEFAAKVDFINYASYSTIFITFSVLAVLAILLMGYINPSTRAWPEKILCKVPFIKKLLLDSAFSDSFAVMSRLMAGRVQFEEAVNITVKGNRSPMVRNYWESVRAAVFRGESLHTAMCSTEGLTLNDRMVVKAHGDFKQFARILDKLAESRAFLYETGMRHMVRFSTFMLIGYGGLVLWLGYLLMSTQDAGIQGMFESNF